MLAVVGTAQFAHARTSWLVNDGPKSRTTALYLQRGCVQFAQMVAEVVVVFDADAGRPRDQHRVGAPVHRSQRRASRSRVPVTVVLERIVRFF